MNASRIQIDTDLRLDLVTPLDAQEIFDLVDANREHLGRFLPWVEGSTTVDSTKAFIRQALEDLADLRQVQYRIVEKDRMVGLIGAMQRYEGTGVYHIGYWLAESETGRGIMTRAAETLIRFCFEELDAPKVEILCAVENETSNRVAERLGFTLEGTIRCAEKLTEGLADLNIYGKLADEA